MPVHPPMDETEEEEYQRIMQDPDLQAEFQQFCREDNKQLVLQDEKYKTWRQLKNKLGQHPKFSATIDPEELPQDEISHHFKQAVLENIDDVESAPAAIKAFLGKNGLPPTYQELDLYIPADFRQHIWQQVTRGGRSHGGARIGAANTSGLARNALCRSSEFNDCRR